MTGSLPNCSASHLPVWPVSANTAFILFSFCRSVFVSMIDLLNLNVKLLNINETANDYAVKHSRWPSHYSDSQLLHHFRASIRCLRRKASRSARLM